MHYVPRICPHIQTHNIMLNLSTKNILKVSVVGCYIICSNAMIIDPYTDTHQNSSIQSPQSYTFSLSSSRIYLYCTLALNNFQPKGNKFIPTHLKQFFYTNNFRTRLLFINLSTHICKHTDQQFMHIYTSWATSIYWVAVRRKKKELLIY